MSKKNILLILVLIIIAGCGSSNDSVKVESLNDGNVVAENLNTNTDTKIALPQDARQDVDAEQELELAIDPASLQIKEIYRTPHDCTFRQRCGRMKLKLINHSDHD